MRIRRIARGLAAATTLSLLMTACGSGGDGGGVSAKFPHHMPADSSDGKCIQDFADQAKEKAGIDFKITPAGALGGEADVDENLFQGVFQATLMSNVMMGVWEESAQVTNLPYVIPDIETGRALLDSDIMKPVYDSLLEKKGVRILGYCHYSVRDIAATKPIRKPADLDGVKIRVPETDAFVKTFKSLGANPTALPFPEVYNSMKTGVVDAAESNFADMLGLKFNEVAPNFSRTSHMFTGQAVVVNEKWFQGLTKEQQDELTKAAKNAEETSYQERLKENEKIVGELKAAGVTVVDDVDREAFDQAVAKVRDELAAEYGVEDLLAKVREFVEENS
ncbi:MAG TPA: TRAP transporter substrate-binding protein [Vulgatibacteraceae bacterium]|nr:TRAP transporter substrate-binding protein [Vulgatibacteraceae bacterium]